jgi:DNA (cytosine-5)-methyltransferase 1
MKDEEKKLTFIDLFAGCGGLSLGAMKAGFVGEFAIEFQKNAFDTLKFNLIDRTKEECLNFGIKPYEWPEELPVTNHDIKKLLLEKKDFLKSLKGKIDLVVGGPPCQGFSNAGKRNENDPRNQLYKSYISFINIVNPKILMIENVAGIASKFSKDGESYKDHILDKLKSKYHIAGKLISSEIFGVPQKRKRYIIIGFSKRYFKAKNINLDSVFNKIDSDSLVFTNEYKYKDSFIDITKTTIEDAIGDLDGENLNSIQYQDENAKSKNYRTFPYKIAVSNFQKLMREGIQNKNQIDSHRIGEHNETTTSKYSKLIEISNSNPNRKGFKFSKEELDIANWNSKKQVINVLKADKQSPTLTTCPFDYVHYSVPRILTVREFARIQSFPDWFQFKGIYATSGSLSYTTPRYTQIGNAVPPLMAESIIRTLKGYL